MANLTIKKSKLTLKAPVAEAPVTAETPAGQPASRPATEALPKETRKPGGGTFQIVSFVFAILAVLVFLALVGIQYFEITFYKDPPSVFLEPSPPSGAPAPAPAPVVTPAATPAAAPAAEASAAGSTSAPPAAAQ